MSAVRTKRHARWTPLRKLALVERVARGEASVHEAAAEAGVSAAELEDWCARWARYGLAGLKVTLVGALRAADRDNNDVWVR